MGGQIFGGNQSDWQQQTHVLSHTSTYSLLKIAKYAGKNKSLSHHKTSRGVAKSVRCLNRGETDRIGTWSAHENRRIDFTKILKHCSIVHEDVDTYLNMF